MIGRTHIALVGALLAVACAAGAFVYGTRVGVAQEQAAQKRANDAANAERRRNQDTIDALAERHQATEYARQANVREIYHESEKVIDRPVYRNVCIDADGIGLLDRATAIANGTGVGEPAGAAAGAALAPAQ